MHEGWARKSDKFDSVKMEGGFRQGGCKEVIDWAGVGLREGTQRTRGGLNNVEGRAREADRLCGDQRDPR